MGRGATRIAASTVPRTRDPAALSADTFTVIQKASRIVWPSPLTKSAIGRLLLERDVELADDRGCLRGHLRQVLAQGGPPLAVVEHGPQGAVNGGDALAVALLEPYSVDLVAEEGADDLELALVLRLGGEAGQDRVVGRDGLDLPAEQLVDAVAVAGQPDQVDRGPVPFLDPVARRGSLPGAHLLALEVICLLDAVVVRAHEDVLVGDVVRPGKRNHLLPFRRDRVRRHDHVYLSLLQKGLAVGGQCRHEIDLRGTQFVRDVIGDVDIEPGILSRRTLQPEPGLIGLHADIQRLVVFGLIDDGVAAAAASAAATATTAARRQDKSKRRCYRSRSGGHP